MRSVEFSAAMETLCDATDDHSWTLGRREILPFEFSGSYFDPRRQGVNRQEALAMLAASGAADSGPEANLDVIIDMIVSDSPEPFYMVNLIDHYARANYPDGDRGLTGEEADNIYGGAILPTLRLFNSGPEFLMNVDVLLTKEPADWELAVIVRYASRDAFLNIFPLNPLAGEALVHKEAGVENTLVYVSERSHATPPEPVNGILYNLRYCEVLLVTIGAGLSVDVYGTQRVNLCPQEQWEAIDRSSVASDFGATFAAFNGPRFFVVDWTSNSEGLGGGDSVYFGELQMHFLTTVEPSADAAIGENAYKVARVARNNIWHFVAGRRIYELKDPDGQQYVMQSFSRAVDPGLELADLASLGDRLELPPGWRFSSRVLNEAIAVPAVNGTAEVVQDELENTYQRIP
jgi:hypothetical protein